MKKTLDSQSKLFCRILKAGLWNERIDLKLCKDDFVRVWNEAQGQTVKGLVGNALVSSECVPPKVAYRIQDHILVIGGTNVKFEKILLKSVSALKSEGVEPVLIKGLGVGSFYQDPLLREPGDIDLYVGIENYKKAFTILSSLPGLKEKTVFEENSKHSHVEIDGVPIEIHRFTDVFPKKYNSAYQAFSDTSLSGSLPTYGLEEGVQVYIPDPTFNALFIFIHFWHHFLNEGIGFRQVCDWTMLLHANYGMINMTNLENMLIELDLKRAWQVFGSIAVEILGLPPHEMPFHNHVFDRYIPMTVEMMMEEGNFGHERIEYWALPRDTFFQKVKVFSLIAGRYLGLYPIFGKAVIHEYIDRMKRRFKS